METTYNAIKKLCLCIYISCTKLKHYIKLVDVYVYSHFGGIKHMLSKPILHSRIGKWALALTEYPLTYCPLKEIKGQIIADFIVDHSVVEAIEGYVETRHVKLYYNGSRHKYGIGVRVFIISSEDIPTKFKFRIEGICSNNEALYEALIIGLQILLDLGARDVDIKGDSKLVVRQLKKKYKCIIDNLMVYFVMDNSLLKHFDHVSINHIPRLENQEANDLAQIASSYKISKERLEDLVDMIDKLISVKSSSETFPMSKLGGM